MTKIKSSINSKGQALVVVVAVLTMLFVITMSFFLLSQAERAAAIKHLDSLRAQYIAEAGVAYAQKILGIDKQTNVIDSLEDLIFKVFEGEDADLDGDGINESKWFSLDDSEGKPFGRFAVKIYDEASRLNINSCSVEALSRLFSELGVETGKADQLIARRPFNAKEEVNSILGSADFAKSKDFITIYSRDVEVDLSRNRRVYLNTSQPRLILEAFLDSGVKDAHQKALNLKDAADTDLNQTLLDKFSQNFVPTGLAEAGGWNKVGTIYEAYSTDDSPGTFVFSNLALEDGEYLCFLHGIQNEDIVAGDPPIYSGEGLKDPVAVEGGSFSVVIKPAKGTTSRFSYVELVSLTPKEGLNRRVVTGTEALVINELMVKPAKEILTGTPSQIAPGETKDWAFSQVKPGNYYVVVEAITPGGLVGDVTISTRPSQNLRDRDYFPTTVTVDVSGEIRIRIKNNSLQDASFKGIKILQEPDTEFIEIVNLSPRSIDLGNFSVDVYTPAGDLVTGWPGRIPPGTSIDSYQHLALTVDNNDSSPAPANLRSNKIFFYGLHNTNAVGLVFDEAGGVINKESDLLPDSGGRVILRDALGERIDAVEYFSFQVKDYTSLERADPSQVSDDNNDGFYDGWHQCTGEDLSTPGLANDNNMMYTRDEDGELARHDISEVSVFNSPLSDLAEVQQLSSGQNWKKISLSDIALMADHFSSEAIDLDLSEHEIEGDGTSGTWEFTGITQGNFLLSVLAESSVLQGKDIRVAVKTSVDSDFTDLQSIIFMQGFAFYGSITIPESSSVLQVKITADSAEDKALLRKIRLEPVFFVAGRVNVNTARPEILRSLLISSGLANTVINSRPIGDKGERLLGIGELLQSDSGFVPFRNYLTVKSDVYEIKSRGDFLQQDRSVAYQTIRTILERGD